MALIAAALFMPVSSAASLTGAVLDPIGGYIVHAVAELDSGTRKYLAQTDSAGVYQFLDLPAGEYRLTIRVPGFKLLTLWSIRVSAEEQKRIPEVTLLVAGGCGEPFRDSLRLLPVQETFGRFSGSVAPPLPNVEVTLVCRTFSVCRSTKTDSNGRFSFDMLSAGVYGLNFHREGYYPENATGYRYYVNAGWESLYGSVRLERCPNGNCDPKLRPKSPVAICE